MASQKKKNSPKVDVTQFQDLERLQSAAREMLSRLEQELRKKYTGDNEFEWMFGGKNSIASNLVSLAELILKLYVSGTKNIDSFAIQEDKLTPADLVLIKEFARKSQDC